jgi:hypothetical protein
MNLIDKFSAVLAVILLITISYFSMTEKVVETETIVHVPYETVVTDTLTITQVDTLWQFRSWREDIVETENSIIISKDFLFHIAEDNPIANAIRDELPFGDVFNFWREKLGNCGLFEWKEQAYITLYKEENIIDCDVTQY